MVKAMVRHEGTFLMALSLVALSFGCAAQSPSLQEFLRNQEMQRADLLQSQRTIAELHAEKQLLQRDLGAARASQARLDGTLRETDRQLHDARYIVDIQREELAKAREERPASRINRTPSRHCFRSPRRPAALRRTIPFKRSSTSPAIRGITCLRFTPKRNSWNLGV